MTPETPVAPIAPVPFAPTHPDRSGWLLALGILDVLFGLFMWVIAAVTVISVAAMAKNQPHQKLSLVSVLLVYGGLGTIWIVLGIFSAMRKNWARLTIVVLTSAWLALGVIITLGFAAFGAAIFRDTPQPAGADPNAWKLGLVFTVVFSAIFMVLVPLLLLLFYTRPSVRATCTTLVPGYRPSPRPLLINILAGMFFVFGGSVVFTLSLHRPIPVAGWVMPWSLSVAYLLLSGAVYLFCGWAFLKLRVAGWWTIVLFTGFTLITGLVTAAQNPLDLYQRMGMGAEEIESVRRMPMLYVSIMTASLALQVVILGLLLWSRRHFSSSSPPAQGVPEAVTTEPVHPA